MFWGYHHFWKHPFVAPQLLPRPPKTVRPMETSGMGDAFELTSELTWARGVTCVTLWGKKPWKFPVGGNDALATPLGNHPNQVGKPPPLPYEKNTQDAGASCARPGLGILCLTFFLLENFSTSGGCSLI